MRSFDCLWYFLHEPLDSLWLIDAFAYLREQIRLKVLSEQKKQAIKTGGKRLKWEAIKEAQRLEEEAAFEAELKLKKKFMLEELDKDVDLETGEILKETRKMKEFPYPFRLEPEPRTEILEDEFPIHLAQEEILGADEVEEDEPEDGDWL